MSTALVLSMSAPLFAQEWTEFASRHDRFTCNVPNQPKATETTYRSEHGADLPARVKDWGGNNAPTPADFS